MRKLVYSNDILLDLLLKIFLPILIIVVIVKIVIDIYAIRATKKKIKDIDNKIIFHSTLISIVITIILLAIAVSFSVDFFNMIKNSQLSEDNNIIYIVIFLCPLIPILFLVYLIPKLVKLIINENKESIHKAHNKKSVPNKVILNDKNDDDDIECI